MVIIIYRYYLYIRLRHYEANLAVNLASLS